VTVQTPEGIEYVLYPAGLPIRVCAYAIDTLIQWVFLIAAAIFFYTMKNTLGQWAALLILFGVNWFYHVGWEIFNRGQSLGKRILGIRVVKSDGSPVSPGASFLRNLLRFADVFMSLCLAGLFSMILSPAFRRLGDWAADTLVVYTPSAQAPNWQPGALAGNSNTDAVAVVRSLPYEEKQAILMFARRYPLLGPALADEIAHTYVEALRADASGNPEHSVQASVGTRGELPEASALSDSAYLLGIAQSFSGDTR
jgi:uncharacterized RDD family membrane protein YckC